MEFDNKQLSFFSSEEFLLKSMIPERFMSEIASIDIIPLKGKVKNFSVSNIDITIKKSAYYLNGGTATLCKVTNGAFYFSDYKDKVFHVNSDLDMNSFRDLLPYYLEKMFPADVFGCCSLYKKCSKEGKCIHINPFYAYACMYKKNLEAGRIFYRDMQGEI